MSKIDADYLAATFHPLPERTIVVFNGPPGSGKDTLADAVAAVLEEREVRTGRRAFKDELYRLAAEVAEIPLERMVEIATDRTLKETPTDELPGGVSPRAWLIHVSEEIIKPNHGKDYFGKSLALAIDPTDEEYIIVSDGGFYGEIDYLADRYGEDRVVVFRVQREGYTFEGDSRDWIDVNGVYFNLKQREGDPSAAVVDALLILEALENIR